MGKLKLSKDSKLVKDFLTKFEKTLTPQTDGFLNWDHPGFGNIYQLSQPNW